MREQFGDMLRSAGLVADPAPGDDTGASGNRNGRERGRHGGKRPGGSRTGDRQQEGGGLEGPVGWLDSPSASWNRFAGSPEMVKAVLCAALAPNLAAVDDTTPLLDRGGATAVGGGGARGPRPAAAAGPEDTPVWAAGPRGGPGGADRVDLHPGCLASGVPSSRFPHPFVVFLEKVTMELWCVLDISQLVASVGRASLPFHSYAPLPYATSYLRHDRSRRPRSSSETSPRSLPWRFCYLEVGCRSFTPRGSSLSMAGSGEIKTWLSAACLQ